MQNNFGLSKYRFSLNKSILSGAILTTIILASFGLFSKNKSQSNLAYNKVESINSSPVSEDTDNASSPAPTMPITIKSSTIPQSTPLPSTQATSTPNPSAGSTSVSTPTPTPTPTAAPVSTPAPTSTPTTTPTPVPTPTPTPTATPTPTPTSSLVTARVYWYTSEGKQYPGQQKFVQIIDLENGSILASGETNDQGYWSGANIASNKNIEVKTTGASFSLNTGSLGTMQNTTLNIH